MGDVGPQFLDAAGAATAEPPARSTPVDRHAPTAHVLATAHGDLPALRHRPGTCVFSGVRGGSRVIVVNVANDRSIDVHGRRCARSTEPQDELVMSAAAFADDRRPDRGADPRRDPPAVTRPRRRLADAP